MMKGKRSSPPPPPPPSSSTLIFFLVFFLATFHHVCADESRHTPDESSLEFNNETTKETGDGGEEVLADVSRISVGKLLFNRTTKLIGKALGKRLPIVHRYSIDLRDDISTLYIHKDLHQRDVTRRLSQPVGGHEDGDDDQTPRRKDAEVTSSPFKMPVHSGFDILSGLYWVEVRVGTPPRPFFLAADTGSDLTWMRCKYDPNLTNETRERLVTEMKNNHHHDPNKKRSHLLNRKTVRVFQADLSSTFKPISCNDAICNKELVMLHSAQSCPTPTSPCRYNYTYLGGNGAAGFFGEDTVTMPLPNGTRSHLPNMVIGCTEDSENFNEGDGVLGLGFMDTSIPEVVVRSKVAFKFSYCLMDHRSNASVTSYLTFGVNDQGVKSPMKYTKLVLRDANKMKTGLYGVNVIGISVGGTMLKVGKQVWDEMLKCGGMLIDSGATNTWLSTPIYEAVMGELTKALSKYAKVELNEKGVPFEFCFSDKGYDVAAVPRVAFHFADGVVFEPPVRNYVLDVTTGVKCLGFVSASDGMSSMIGNQMQQNYLWEYDMGHGTVGFAPSNCN